MRKQDKKNSVATATVTEPTKTPLRAMPVHQEAPCCLHGGVTFEEAIRVRAYQLWSPRAYILG